MAGLKNIIGNSTKAGELAALESLTKLRAGEPGTFRINSNDHRVRGKMFTSEAQAKEYAADKGLGDAEVVPVEGVGKDAINAAAGTETPSLGDIVKGGASDFVGGMAQGVKDIASLPGKVVDAVKEYRAPAAKQAVGGLGKKLGGKGYTPPEYSPEFLQAAKENKSYSEVPESALPDWAAKAEKLVPEKRATKKGRAKAVEDLPQPEKKPEVKRRPAPKEKAPTSVAEEAAPASPDREAAGGTPGAAREEYVSAPKEEPKATSEEKHDEIVEAIKGDDIEKPVSKEVAPEATDDLFPTVPESSREVPKAAAAPEPGTDLVPWVPGQSNLPAKTGRGPATAVEPYTPEEGPITIRAARRLALPPKSPAPTKALRELTEGTTPDLANVGTVAAKKTGSSGLGENIANGVTATAGGLVALQALQALQNSGKSDTIDTGNAGGTTMTPMAKKVEQWLQANPTDPRAPDAARWLRKHGGK